VGNKNELIKIEILKSYFDVLFYKDILERYKVENEYALKILMKNIALGYTKVFSVNKVFRFLKSQGYSVSINTLYNYFSYLQNVFFIDLLNNFFSPRV
jgi:predicted AAA+ superfamily ATPase